MTTTAALHLGFSYTDKRSNMTGPTNCLDRARITGTPYIIIEKRTDFFNGHGKIVSLPFLVPNTTNSGWMVPAIYLPLLLDGE